MDVQAQEQDAIGPIDPALRQFHILESLQYLLTHPVFFNLPSGPYGRPQLIHIGRSEVEKINPLDGPVGGPDPLMAAPKIMGTVEFLDPFDVTKIVKTIPYKFPQPNYVNLAGFPKSWPGTFSIDAEPAYALALLDPKQVEAGLISSWPAATILIPEAWTADFGKIVTAPDPASFFVPKPPANLATASKWDLLVYGYNLAETNFPQFRQQYPGLFQHGDMYLAAILTDWLVKYGVKNKVDMNAELEATLASATDSPDHLAAIVMAMVKNEPTLGNAELSKLVGMVRQAAATGQEWENTRALLLKLQFHPEESTPTFELGKSAAGTSNQSPSSTPVPALTTAASSATSWPWAAAVVAVLLGGIVWLAKRQ